MLILMTSFQQNILFIYYYYYYYYYIFCINYCTLQNYQFTSKYCCVDKINRILQVNSMINCMNLMCIMGVGFGGVMEGK